MNRLTKISFSAITVLLYTLVYFNSFGKDRTLVYRFYITDEISPAIARKASQAVNEAIAIKADYIFIHMNTYGGLLEAADSIRTTLLNSPVPVIVFINNNAASAGALIAIACNRIYMKTGSSIGAATVVNQNAEAMPDKYQSYMRSMMRATAEARNRNPQIAEAMVDPTITIEGVIDSGKVLTFTPSEAVKNGYCDGIAENWRDVLSAEQITDYDTKIYDPTWVENIIGFLIHPAVSGVLILIMLGGLYYEMQQPGIGFPLFAGILAAILYFAPLYLEGLAANWEILVFITGMALIAVEIFLIPGFGIAGISGIILVIGGLTATLLNNNGFDFSAIGSRQILSSMAMVILSIVGSLVFFFTIGKGLINSSVFNKLVLNTTMEPGSGQVGPEFKVIKTGMVGMTVTMLKPAGKVLIENEIFTGKAENGFIEQGKKVMVINQDGMGVLVREIHDEPA